MEWYLKVLRDNFANFEGRARRKEYWMFALFNMLFIIAIYVLLIIGIISESGAISTVAGLLLSVYVLALLVPSIAVVVRRLHDQDKSGTWYFIAFIPIIGGIWLLVLMATEGTNGPNQYGEDPKAGVID